MLSGRRGPNPSIYKPDFCMLSDVAQALDLDHCSNLRRDCGSTTAQPKRNDLQAQVVDFIVWERFYRDVFSLWQSWSNHGHRQVGSIVCIPATHVTGERLFRVWRERLDLATGRFHGDYRFWLIQNVIGRRLGGPKRTENFFPVTSTRGIRSRHQRCRE